jgi:hypothetical protein
MSPEVRCEAAHVFLFGFVLVSYYFSVTMGLVVYCRPAGERLGAKFIQRQNGLQVARPLRQPEVLFRSGRLGCETRTELFVHFFDRPLRCLHITTKRKRNCFCFVSVSASTHLKQKRQNCFRVVSAVFDMSNIVSVF